jgi:putative addiction module component (TIGR02574 family)
MNAPFVDKVLKLSVEERMRLVDLIWASLDADQDSIPIFDAHFELVEE